MNIKVIREKGHPSYLTGGECAEQTVKIYVDKKLPLELQRELVIHAIVENWLPSIPHDKVDELTELLKEGLEQLEASTIENKAI